MWWRVAPLMVGRGVLCCVALRCGVLCCVVLRCVVWCRCGVWPLSWWGMRRWCVVPLVVGRVAPVCGPPHGGAWCFGVGVLCCVALHCVSLWCVAPLRVGRTAVVCGPHHGRACCGGVWPPSWWGVLRCCVAPRMVVRAALGCCVLFCLALCVVVVCTPPHGGTVVFVLCRAASPCVVLCCVALRFVVWCGGGVGPPSWPGVLRWCVAPRMLELAALGCAVLRSLALCVIVMCGPPYGGACCVDV